MTVMVMFTSSKVALCIDFVMYTRPTFIKGLQSWLQDATLKKKIWTNIYINSWLKYWNQTCQWCNQRGKKVKYDRSIKFDQQNMKFNKQNIQLDLMKVSNFIIWNLAAFLSTVIIMITYTLIILVISSRGYSTLMPEK